MDSLLHLLQHYGLWLVFANVLALQLGLPVPAYPTLVVVGALAARSDVPIPLVIAIAVLASLAADLAWYFAGARHGRRVLNLMCRLSLSPDNCVRQTESIFDRWGAPSLLVAKFVPGFAAVATGMAGAMRLSVWRFIAFDAIGAALWSGVAVLAGWLLRDAVDQVLGALGRAGFWGLVILVSALALHVAFKAVQRHRLIRSLRMSRVSVDDLHRRLAAREPTLLLDVRSAASHRKERIPGALHIDSNAVEQSLEAHGLRERIGDEVIVYCACPNEASAAMVARKLMRAGFTRVRPLHGGIEAWAAKGYRVIGS